MLKNKKLRRILITSGMAIALLSPIAVSTVTSGTIMPNAIINAQAKRRHHKHYKHHRRIRHRQRRRHRHTRHKRGRRHSRRHKRIRRRRHARKRHTHHKYNTRVWHKGMPSTLRRSAVWISNPVWRRGEYSRAVTGLGGKYGYNPTPFYFNKHHHFEQTGTDEGALGAIHPSYRILGYHRYLIKSGTPGLYIYAKVQVHNKNSLTIWQPHQYDGFFHKINRKKAHYFEYHPRF